MNRGDSQPEIDRNTESGNWEGRFQNPDTGRTWDVEIRSTAMVYEGENRVRRESAFSWGCTSDDAHYIKMKDGEPLHDTAEDALRDAQQHVLAEDKAAASKP